MRCEEVRPLLSAGLDGELEPGIAAQVDAHLSGCALCSAEREALTETVRWMRTLPEAQPPAELRRRIGVALLEAERAAAGRRSGLGLLGRLPAKGWTWGAALGAAVAAVALVSTRAPERRQAVLPPSPVAPLSVPKPAAPPARRIARARSAPLALRQPAPQAVKPAAAAPEVALQPPAPELTPPQLPIPSAAPAHPVVRGRPAEPGARPARHSLVIARHKGSPGSAPRRGAPGAPRPQQPSSARPAPLVDDSSMLAHMESAPPPDAAMPDAPDQEGRSSTSGMTQMASGTADPDAPAADSDDLSELRRRLTDRPLQVPDLGELKSSRSRSSRDGWVRF